MRCIACNVEISVYEDKTFDGYCSECFDAGNYNDLEIDAAIDSDTEYDE